MVDKTELYSTPRPRITAAMLPRFAGKNVTMLGTVDPASVRVRKHICMYIFFPFFYKGFLCSTVKSRN